MYTCFSPHVFPVYNVCFPCMGAHCYPVEKQPSVTIGKAGPVSFYLWVICGKCVGILWYQTQLYKMVSHTAKLNKAAKCNHGNSYYKLPTHWWCAKCNQIAEKYNHNFFNDCFLWIPNLWAFCLVGIPEKFW